MRHVLRKSCSSQCPILNARTTKIATRVLMTRIVDGAAAQARVSRLDLTALDLAIMDLAQNIGTITTALVRTAYIVKKLS